jgi:hypothetical protein
VNFWEDYLLLMDFIDLAEIFQAFKVAFALGIIK